MTRRVSRGPKRGHRCVAVRRIWRLFPDHARHKVGETLMQVRIVAQISFARRWKLQVASLREMAGVRRQVDAPGNLMNAADDEFIHSERIGRAGWIFRRNFPRDSSGRGIRLPCNRVANHSSTTQPRASPSAAVAPRTASNEKPRNDRRLFLCQHGLADEIGSPRHPCRHCCRLPLSASFVGASPTIASFVITRPATHAAFCSA